MTIVVDCNHNKLKCSYTPQKIIGDNGDLLPQTGIELTSYIAVGVLEILILGVLIVIKKRRRQRVAGSL